MGLSRSSVETNRAVTGGLLPENNRKELFSATNTNTCESQSERIIQGHDEGKAIVYGCLTLAYAVQERGTIASKNCCYALKQRTN